MIHGLWWLWGSPTAEIIILFVGLILVTAGLDEWANPQVSEQNCLGRTRNKQSPKYKEVHFKPKKTVEFSGWPFPKWPRTHRFYHSYLMTLLTHELQHARQTEQGIQYKRENWMGYDERIDDKSPVEYDACMAEFKKAHKMLRSYCER